jgi:hypothetical protein
LALPTVLFGANHYAWCGASGAGTGAEWTDAFTDLPASLTRGDTYYVAGSSSCTYGAHTFNDPLSGTSVISILRATAANSGSVPGWQASFGSAPAKWNNPLTLTTSGAKYIWYFQQGYYTIDGQFGTGNAAGGFGFWLQRPMSDSGDDYNYIWCDAGAGNTLTNMSFNHIEVDGISINFAAMVAGAGTFFAQPRAGASYANFVFQNDYFHDMENGFYSLNAMTNLVIDHVWHARSEYNVPNSVHGNGVAVGPGNSATTATSMSEVGTTVTATLSPAPTGWPVGTPIAITQAVPTGYNINSVITAIKGNQIQFTAPAGLGQATSSVTCNTTAGVACVFLAFNLSNLTFSNSMWQDVCGTSVITNMNGTVTNEYIYGNVFWQTTPNESFDGVNLFQCNGGAAVIGDLGSNGATSTNVKIYNNTFMTNTPNGGVQFTNPAASGIDQENNLFFNSPNVRLMNPSDLGGGNTEAYNTLLNSTQSAFWSCGGPGDSCQNVSGPSINSSSSRTSGIVDLIMNGNGLNYNSGDGLIVLGSQTGRIPCGLDTVYPYPAATKISSTEATFSQAGPTIVAGTCGNGYGTVLDASGATMPFIDPVTKLNFALSSDQADSHLNDGNNLTGICGSWTPPCTLDPNGNQRPGSGAWDRGAYQSAQQPSPPGLNPPTVH